MSQIEKRTISLPHEHAVFAGLRALQERDAAVERWLREQVAPIYDLMKAEPDRAIGAAKVFSKLRRRGGSRIKASSQT